MAESGLSPRPSGSTASYRVTRFTAATAAGAVAVALPLVGLVSLLLREHLDPHVHNYRLHFVVFGIVGGFVFALGYAAGEAANRRGDARVLLLSLAFMATGGFLGLHALGTEDVLFVQGHPGFKVAIPIGLVVSAGFAAASAFIDLRPELVPWLIRNRQTLRSLILLSMAVWFGWTVNNVPPLDGSHSEAARSSFVAVLSIVGAAVYAASAARYWSLFRQSRKLLPAAVTACFILLAEAMIGVALTGERTWHASWWEWHGLIAVAYLIIGFAARREWREERFRDLYLPSTRERRQEISVLFGDLAGFTAYAEQSEPVEVAQLLDAYWSRAAPLVARHGGDLEKFIGDGIVATFNGRGDQPDHAVRAARTALALQDEVAALAERHPEWPRLRIGVNSGEAVLREIGGTGHVAYPLVGDTINTAARLEAAAAVGSVLIGVGTYERLPEGALVEARGQIALKGKRVAPHAYVLRTLPTE